MENPGIDTNTVPHPNFDQQFAKFEQIQKPTGETINVYDIKPENPKDNVPVFIAQGWCGSAKGYKDNKRILFCKRRT